MSERSFEGRRVLARPLGEADAQPLLDAVSASRAQLRRRFGWVEAVAVLEDIQRFIRAKAEAWEAGKASTFGIFDSKDERLLGVAALDPIVSEVLRAQLSIWIRGDQQDKGFAADAGRIAVDYAFKKLALHRLFARIDPSNRAARKVLQRLGFRYEGCLRQHKRLHGRWIDQECWGMLRADWKPTHLPPRRGGK